MREGNLKRFYEFMESLRRRLGGFLYLRDCSGRDNWPRRGVYFFFDHNEPRSDSGTGPRVVRVGTHALSEKSSTSLWQRLSQHAGSKSSGLGNHRGSIFRLLVGEAMQMREKATEPKSWGVGPDPSKAAAKLGLSAAQVREAERDLEVAVSRYIRDLPFLVVAAEDTPGSNSVRGLIERNGIALLSNHGKEVKDVATPSWLGRYSGRERVRLSGLWNSNHVDEIFDPRSLEILERQIAVTEPVKRP